MSSFKQLSKADVTSVSYAANKRWNLDFNCFPTSSEYITLYKGTNFTGSFSPTEPTSSGQYERLVFNSINHLFYQKYTDVLNTGSLMFDVTTYESASQQRPTNSYFDYNTNPLLIKSFPTGVNESIRVLVINQDIYGSKVLPTSFVLTSSAYSVKDDGYGNLYDSGSIHIGNLFYAHGIGVITNQDYQSMFPSSSVNCVPTTTTTSTTTTTTTAAPTTTTTTSTTTTTTTEPTTTTTTSTTTTTTTEPTTTTTTSTTTTTTTEPTTTTTTTSTTTTTTTLPPTTTSTTTTTTTSGSGCTVQVSVDNNATGGIGCDIVYVNGIAVTYDSGDNFTVEPGELGYFTTNEIGTYTVDVSYTSHTGDKAINLVDCNSNAFCIDNLNTAGGTAIFNNVVLNCPCGGGIQIVFNNGDCL